MAGKSDPFILSLGRLTREIKATIDAIPTDSGKKMAIQLGRDILNGLELELTGAPRAGLHSATQVEA